MGSMSRFRNSGSARQFYIWIVVAASLFVAAANRFYRDGASDLGFIVAMSVAVVIALAIVAPRRFTSIRGGAPDWEDENPYKPSPDDDESDSPSDHSSISRPNQGSKNDAA